MTRHLLLLVAILLVFHVEYSLGNNVSIVVIGAGASGIAAATRLMQNNFTNVIILEAENRIGGRIMSESFNDTIVDLGAEYCHGEKDNIVFAMASQLNLLNSNKPEYVLYYSGSGEEIGIDMYETLFDLAHCISHRKEYNASESDACLGMISKGICLKHKFEELLNRTKIEQKDMLSNSYDWLRSYKSATESCINLDNVSLVSDYEECEGDQMLDWGGAGFETILDVMMHKHAAQKDEEPLDVNILFRHKVLEIENWDNGSKLRLKLEDSKHYDTDHVIFTPSLGVLKSNHEQLFCPSLQLERITAINNIGFGLIVKVALYFEKPWWMIHGSRMWGCILSTEHNVELKRQNLTWVKHFTALTAPPNVLRVLIAWFAGEAVMHLEQASHYDILRGIRFLLSKCFAAYPDIDMPKMIKKSAWWQNENFRGTFSYDSVEGITVGGKRLRQDLSSPIINKEGAPVLLFAGEATHPNKFATVHGAIETGYREADRIITFYRNKA